MSDRIGGDPDEHSDWYDTFLTASTVIFSVEYALRLWSCVEDERFTHPVIGRCVSWCIVCWRNALILECANRLTWMIRPMSVIDLVVLIPFYVELCFKYSCVVASARLLEGGAVELLVDAPVVVCLLNAASRRRTRAS